MSRAFMRCLGMDEVPLEFIDVNAAVWAVAAPGFGTVIVTRDAEHVNAGQALVTRWPGTEHYHDVTRIDGRIEIPMLHKVDRLDVVIEP